MRLPALEHLVRAIRELHPGCEITVVGSSALLGKFPDLGEEGGPLVTSFDADIIPEPFSEDIGMMLHESLGEDRRFHLIHGYHADILRPKIGEQFPIGWKERRVPLKPFNNIFCLEAHDLAACKCLVGRPKDLALVEDLVRRNIVQLGEIEKRLSEIRLPESKIVSSHQNFIRVRNSINRLTN